jgi:hypothetical protein
MQAILALGPDSPSCNVEDRASEGNTLAAGFSFRTNPIRYSLIVRRSHVKVYQSSPAASAGGVDITRSSGVLLSSHNQLMPLGQ